MKAPEEEHTISVAKVLSWLEWRRKQSEREAEEESSEGAVEELIFEERSQNLVEANLIRARESAQ